MQNKFTHRGQLILVAIVFLAACSVETRPVRAGASLQSLDRETADLADVAADSLQLAELLGNKRVLVVFDIDNTLLAMEQGLGADQWYEWQKELSAQDPCNAGYVGDRFAVQGALYFASAMRRTQADGAQQVSSIQKRGIPVISLTSRGMEFRLQTFRELRRNGFSFAYSAIGPAGGIKESFVPVEGGRDSLYEDGVFFSSGQHKGLMLDSLLQKTGSALPAVIVMADDKQKNLDDVKETFSKRGVPVHAWRYTAEDENVSAFDPDLAHRQWISIEPALRQIQQVLGPDNYDLDSAIRPVDCQ